MNKKLKQGWSSNLSLLSILASLFLLSLTPASAGTMFMAADTEDFAGGLPCSPSAGGGPGVDRLGVITTDGPSVTNVDIICTDFLLNGMADADGKLLAGTPNANPLNTVSFDGVLLDSIIAPGIPNSGCCNEEMLFVPQGDGTAKFYHAHYSDVIREIDPETGVQIGASFPQPDTVGMALVNGDIWITHWSARQVGIWDPDTNTFTLKFNLIGLGNAGALAWDPFSQVLWIGSSGGNITPFDLAGNQLGATEQPFGAFGATVDGLTFLGEVTEPSGGVCVYQEETLGEGDFALLGSVDEFDHSAETAAQAYNYVGSSYAGTPPDAISNLSQLFMVNTSEGGSSLFVVHDAPNDGSGGTVDLLLSLTGDSADALFSDDGGEIVESPDNTFTASHNWVECCTDGGVIGTLEGNWSMLIDPNFISGIDSWQVTPASGSPIGLDMMRQVKLEPCEDEVEPLSKTIVDGPDIDQDGEVDAIIAVKQTQTTEYTWRISYNGPDGVDAEITDVAPAESVVLAINADPTSLPLGCGEATDFGDDSGVVDVYRGGKIGKNCHSSTGITWLPDSNQETLDVTVTMRESPGGGHKQPAFAPTSCGALYLNEGAVADLYDPATGEPAIDPDSEEPLGPLTSNQLCIAAVKNPTEFGFDADNDGDNLADHAEACVNEVRTNPCRADTDGDGINDDVDSCPVDYNSGIDTDLDGTDNICDTDDDGDGTPDEEDPCPLDPTDSC